jgi:hypothetical protein
MPENSTIAYPKVAYPPRNPSPEENPNPMIKKIVAALTTAFVAVALVVVGAVAPASAHDATLTPVAVCTTSTGAAVVTWTVTNDYNEVVTVTASNNAAIPVNATLAATGGNNKPDVTKTFTQNVPAPAAGVTATATVTFVWSGDQFTQTKTASTTVGNTCVVPTPTDASATLVDKAASCAAAETVSEGAVSNANWAGPITYNGTGNTHYSAVATAASGHKFPTGSGVTNNGKTLTLTGTLSPKVTRGCSAPPPPPVCIPDSAVSYTYSNNDANSGVITVTDVSNSTGQLCHPFYVTAASWVFTGNTGIWPQLLDKTDKLAKISAPGHYDYAAQVTCGQGDIYASTDSSAPSLNPGPELDGPNNPFAEHFLSDMGFSGPSPTYVVDANSCWQRTPETGTPTITVASCAVDSTNGVTLPAVLGGVWTVSGAGYSHSYSIGSGATISTPPHGYQSYTITLTDGSLYDGYAVTAAHSPWTWTPVDKSGLDCAHYQPSVTDLTGACTYTDGSSETVTFTFDNTLSNKPVTFSIPSLSISVVVAAGATGSAQAQVGTSGGSYQVNMTGSSPQTIQVPTFAGCQPEAGTPTFNLATCAVDSVPTADLPAVPGGEWTITDGTYSHTYGVGDGVTALQVPDGFVDYTISLADGDSTDGYVVTASNTPWSPQSQATLDCAHYAPSSSEAVGTCEYVDSASAETVTFTFDNTASNRSVDFVVTSLGIDVVVPAGGTGSAEGQVGTAGGTYQVDMTGSDSQTFEIAGFTGCIPVVVPADPSVQQLACDSEGNLVGGAIGVALDPRLIYTISGPAGFTTISPVTALVTPLSAGSYVVSVEAATGYVLTGASSWPETIPIDPLTCTTVQASATAAPATCTDENVSVLGSVTVDLSDTHILYFIDGAADTQATTTVSLGAHTVTAELAPGAAAAGYVLTGTTSWPFTFFSGCLPTEAAFHANATGSDAVCTDGSPLGTITLEHDASETGDVGYTIQKTGSSTVTDLGKTATTVQVAPGTYTVTAYVAPGDGFQTAHEWTITINWDGVVCATTSVLAFTGGTIGLFGLALAVSMLFLGIAALYIRRRRARESE